MCLGSSCPITLFLPSMLRASVTRMQKTEVFWVVQKYLEELDWKKEEAMKAMVFTTDLYLMLNK